MPQLTANLAHTERDASDVAGTQPVRVYLALLSGTTYVLDNSLGSAAAWLVTTAGVQNFDNDSTLENRVPYALTTTLIVI